MTWEEAGKLPRAKCRKCCAVLRVIFLADGVCRDRKRCKERKREHRGCEDCCP